MTQPLSKAAKQPAGLRRLSKFLALSLSVIAAPAAYGQIQFVEATGTSFVQNGEQGCVTFADVNGDGAPDVLITGGKTVSPQSAQFESNLYLNDGSGHFTLKTPSGIDRSEYGGVAFADINGDTAPDLFLTGRYGVYPNVLSAKLYKNDGSGNFSLVAGTPFPDIYTSSVAFADIDNDHDMDLMLTGSGASSRYIGLYTNDGNGTFTKAGNTPFVPVSSANIVFGDVNGDGFTDVLVTGYSNAGQSSVNVYINDQKGNFTVASNTGLDPVWSGTSGHYTAMADIDGDGDLDVLLTGNETPITAQSLITKLYKNDGTGHFQEVQGTHFPALDKASVAFADVDADGDMDLLLTGQTKDGDRIANLYENDGTGSFKEVTGLPFTGVYGAAAFADVNGDGMPDVIISGIAQGDKLSTKLFLNKTPNPAAGSPAITITKLDPPADYCRNSKVTVAYQATGTYNQGNTFTAWLSDEHGDFTNATNIGSVSGTAASGTINAVIPGTAATGSQYRIRVVSSSPAVTGKDNGKDLSINGSADMSFFDTHTDPDPPEVCEGEQVTLSGIYRAFTLPSGPKPSFSWDHGVINGQPFAPGTTRTYTMTGSMAGCTTTLKVTVTVTPAPSVSALVPKGPFCDGDTVTLYGFGGKNVSFQWDNGVVNGQPFVPHVTKVYTVTGTDSRTGCSDTAQVEITVHPLPQVKAIAQPGTDICEGHEVTLSGSGAATYDWNHNITNGQAFIPVQTETYTVIGTDANGCVDSTDITVKVKDTAVILVADTICSGEVYGFGTQTLHKAGTYTEVFVASNGCDSTVTLNLAVKTVDVSVAQNGNELKAADGATAYQWLDCNKNKQPIPGATQPAYRSDISGDFAVTVTDGDCTDTSVCYHLEGKEGIHSIDFSRRVTLSPNPNNGRMTIHSAYLLRNATARVVNMVGQTVKEISHISGNRFDIDMPLYAAGVYYVTIKDGSQTARVKFVKE